MFSRMIFRINSPTKYAVVQDFVTLSSNEYSVRVHAVYSNSAYSKGSFFLLSIWNPTTCNCLFFFFFRKLNRFFDSFPFSLSLSFHLIIVKRYTSVRSNKADATLTKMAMNRWMYIPSCNTEILFQSRIPQIALQVCPSLL